MFNINFGHAPIKLSVAKIAKDGLKKEENVISKAIEDSYFKFDEFTPKPNVKAEEEVVHTRYDAPYIIKKESEDKIKCPTEAWY